MIVFFCGIWSTPILATEPNVAPPYLHYIFSVILLDKCSFPTTCAQTRPGPSQAKDWCKSEWLPDPNDLASTEVLAGRSLSASRQPRTCGAGHGAMSAE